MTIEGKQSARDSLGNLDMDTLTEDAAALIEELHLNKCHFVGNSMGGFIALRLASRRPDLLLSSTVLGSSAEQEYKIEDFKPVVEQLQKYGGKPIVDTLMYIMFGDHSLTDEQFAIERSYWQEYMTSLDPSIGDAAYQVVFRNSVLEELNNVEVPILAIAGAEDHAYTIPQSENIARAVKNGVCKVVQGSGHSVAVEKPTEVNEILVAHLEKSLQIPLGE